MKHETKVPRPGTTAKPGQSARILIIESRFYETIANELLAGATAELEAQGATWEQIAVPGSLEIPLALNQAISLGWRWDGVVALGCVIRGETFHFEIVATNANHWLMEVALKHGIPLGNGILTVDTEAQALARAQGGRRGKGGDAARACLALVALARTLAKASP